MVMNLQAVNISKSFQKKSIFNNFSCEFKEGINEIRGESGCGKSTIFKMLYGIEKIDSGYFLLDGKRLPDSDDARLAFAQKHISILLQERFLIETMSLEDNIKASFTTFSEDKYKELLSILNYQYSRIPICYQSGGEKKKANLIFALLQEKEIYLLDEPFANLDKEAVASLIFYLNKNYQNKLVIIINHSINTEDLKSTQVIYFSEQQN